MRDYGGSAPTGTPAVMNAGPCGPKVSSPTSSFSWVPTGEYTIPIEETAAQNLTFAMYLDARFASLHSHVLA